MLYRNHHSVPSELSRADRAEGPGYERMRFRLPLPSSVFLRIRKNHLRNAKFPKMGMMHSTSGKLGYNLHSTPTDYVFERELLVRVLKREDELRFSEDTQRLYSEEHPNYLRHIKEVTRGVQERALRVSSVFGISAFRLTCVPSRNAALQRSR